MRQVAGDKYVQLGACVEKSVGIAVGIGSFRAKMWRIIIALPLKLEGARPDGGVRVRHGELPLQASLQEIMLPRIKSQHRQRDTKGNDSIRCNAIGKEGDPAGHVGHRVAAGAMKGGAAPLDEHHAWFYPARIATSFFAAGRPEP